MIQKIISPREYHRVFIYLMIGKIVENRSMDHCQEQGRFILTLFEIQAQDNMSKKLS